MPPLRILICLLYYRPHCTGLTRHVQMLAEGLVARGHSVTVLTSRYSRELPARSETQGVRIERLWSPIRLSRGMIMPGYPRALWRLLRSHDVVSVHTPMLEAALVSQLARQAGIGCVATHHGDLTLPPGIVNWGIQTTMNCLQHRMARRADALVAYSEDYLEYSPLLWPYRQKVRVIAPPVEMPTPVVEASAGLRRRWQNGSGPILGFSGRFVREKRPDVLIRSLEFLDQSFPNARIVFAGQVDIPYENTKRRLRDLLQGCGSRLEFLGLIDDRQELANFYAACDILALPSDTECFGLVQVEAMLCGTPVVASDIPGGRVPVQTTGMGRLFEPGDPRNLAEAMANVLDQPAEFSRPREEIEAIFSLQETLDRYEETLQQHARPRGGL